jgi:hypothetical protein
MGQSRRLASVADGTARAFAGRNNDLDGWWAAGLLLEALPNGVYYMLDLLAGSSEPGLGGSRLRGPDHPFTTEVVIETTRGRRYVGLASSHCTTRESLGLFPMRSTSRDDIGRVSERMSRSSGVDAG